MEEGNDRAFKLRATTSVDGGGAERLPHDGLADVGGDEEGDTGSKTVSLLEELVQKEDNQPSTHELATKKKEGDKYGVAEN